MFCTAINCIDGRVQLPVINHLMDHYGVDYVDMITEPGPVLVLTDEKKIQQADSIIHRVGLSIKVHKTKLIAIVAHYNCLANPVHKTQQLIQLKDSVKVIRENFLSAHILGLWVNKHRVVDEITHMKGMRNGRK